MTAKYIQVHLRTPLDAGEILGLLEEGESLGALETEDGICLYYLRERWTSRMRDNLINALTCLGDPQAADTLAVVDVPDRDWNRSWAESLQPITLGRRILVRQSWNSAVLPSGGFELVIDPRRAFGTGYHATTRLAVEWLDREIRGDERLFDVGTGSGILAMAALRLGAQSALGIDIDPEAIECAKEYARTNGFGSELELRVASLEEVAAEPFDLVLANLDRNTLLRYFPAFHPYLGPGGRLLVSGLLADDESEIAAALARTRWIVHARSRRDEWVALELRRSEG